MTATNAAPGARDTGVLRHLGTQMNAHEWPIRSGVYAQAPDGIDLATEDA